MVALGRVEGKEGQGQVEFDAPLGKRSFAVYHWSEGSSKDVAGHLVILKTPAEANVRVVNIPLNPPLVEADAESGRVLDITNVLAEAFG